MDSEPPELGISIDYDPDSDAYRATFDGAEIEPSTAVVEAMAHVCETDPLHLDPLYYVLDPTALDRICNGRDRDGDRVVEFDYRSHRVRVKSYGVIDIRPADGDT